jgi:hypothetical protein
MALNSYVRDTAKVRDFIEEVAKCQTHFAFLELQKKGATPKGCAKSTKGGGWRRQTLERSELHRALTVEKYYGDNFCAAQDIFVRRDIQAEFQRQARYRNLIYSIYYLSVFACF